MKKYRITELKGQALRTATFEAQTAEPTASEKITLKLDMAYQLAAKYHISPKEAHSIGELAEKYNLTFEDIVYIRDTINGTGAEEEE